MTEKGLFERGPMIVGVMSNLAARDANRANASGADLIELRLDLLRDEDRSVEKVKDFISALKIPLLITNRKKEEGGSFTGTEEERITLLGSILEAAEVDAVDIELSTFAAGKTRIVETAKRHSVPVIVSYHDFKGMPPRSELFKIITRMYEAGGTIAKIAVTPQTLSDALLLLDLTHELSRDGKLVATIGMGPLGRHLRVIAPLYGSVLTYGFIEGEQEVAPGQFSVKELKSMLEKLGIKKSSS